MDTYIDSARLFLDHRKELLNAGIEAGKFQPLVFPRDFASIPIIIFALIIKWPRNGPIRYLKHLLYFYSLYLNIYVVLYSRTLILLGGYCVGLIFSWISIWGANLLLFSDVQGKYKRIERSFEPLEIAKQNLANGKKASLDHDLGSVRSRLSQDKRTPAQNSTMGEAICSSTKLVRRFRWQGYPETLGHRLTWVFDVFISHRGPHWNWRPKDFPPLPKQVQLQLNHDDTTELSDDMIWAEDDTKARLTVVFCSMLIYYLCLDLLKVIVIGDQYFLGYVDSPPSPFFDICGVMAPTFSLVHRLLLNTMAVHFAIVFPVSFITTVYLALSLTPLRFKTRTPIEVSFLYPPYFGNILTSVLDGGLIGLWGTCWHKYLRAGFLAPGNWLKSVIMVASTGEKQRPSSIFWGLQVIFSFTLSGVVHSAGSYTQIVPTNPSRQFLFFVCQIIGIFIQVLIEKLSKRVIPFEIPLWVKRLSKFSFTFTWMVCFGHLLCDDFVLGGVWMDEPVPYSPLRALGFGIEGGSAMRWEAMPVRWWKGERWWEHGIII
ncbi:hypothetical protein FQN49_001088 [Arthroderma sp. PD_2]|nr:hypothetical protein FQN49_001088 [Arthroderma sp. PD_2]